jgi:radical SAM protein with 4Fe4S-binding SPASM domain
MTTNLVQSVRKAGIYCRTLDLVPRRFKHMYSELVYNAASVAHYQRTDMFTSVAIETTSECNRRCTFCPNYDDNKRSQRPQREMDDELYLKILTDLQDIGYCDVVSLQHYGEPLLDTKLEQRVSLARRMLPNAYLQTKSNGDKLNSARYKSLREAGINEIFVTNYNPDNKLNHNLRDLAEYMLWHPEESEHFSIRPTPRFLFNRAGSAQVTDEQKIQLSRCIQESHTININVKGDVVLCSNDYFGNDPFGNVFLQHIMDIWDSSTYKQHRKNIRRGDFESPLCQECTE